MNDENGQARSRMGAIVVGMNLSEAVSEFLRPHQLQCLYIALQRTFGISMYMHACTRIIQML